MQAPKPCYKAIFDQDCRQALQDYITALGKHKIDYFAIGFQDTVHKKSLSLMSNLAWQKRFASENYAAHDPVRKAAFGCTKHFFSFDQIDFCDSLGKKIMQERQSFNIAKGLVILERHPAYNYMLTLATGFSQFDAVNFYFRYKESLKTILCDLKEILRAEVKKQGFI